MEKLLKRMIVIIVIFTVGLTLLSMFGIYSPLQRTIQREKQKNFSTTARIYKDTLDAFFKNAHEKANLITSDYYTKNTLRSFKDGELTNQETTALFETAFSVTMSNISNLSYAEIVSGDTSIIAYGSVNDDYLDSLEIDYYEIGIIQNEDKYNAIIVYPIYSPVDSSMTGRLIMEYDLTQSMSSLFISQYSFALSNQRSHNDYIINKSSDIRSNGSTLYLTGDSLYYLGKFEYANIYYAISINSKALYGVIDTSVKFSLLTIIAITVVAFLLLNASVFKKMATVLKKNKVQSDAIMKIADYDSMTKAYSRSYFDRYVENFHAMYDSNWSASLVMIDFDNLKLINDQFGHIAGDTVLKITSKIILDSLRKNDLLFRFGGDEFVLILEDCDLVLAKKIVSRIISEISRENDSSNYPIAISYGISLLMYDSEIMTVINEADKMMYKNKNRNQEKKYDLFSIE